MLNKSKYLKKPFYKGILDDESSIFFKILDEDGLCLIVVNKGIFIEHMSIFEEYSKNKLMIDKFKKISKKDFEDAWQRKIHTLQYTKVFV